MTITGAMVLFAVIWFLGLFIALPLGLKSQDEAGEVEPGTPASAPSNPDVARKMKWVTLGTLVIWAPLCGLIASGWIGINDIDVWGRMATTTLP